MSKQPRLGIVVTGGGTGGHIMPVLAVAEQVMRLRPEARITYIGQTGDGLNDVPEHHPAIAKVYTVRAGKLRRYHGEGIKQLFDLKTVWLNLRDIVFLVVGLWQSFWLLKKLRPLVIFTRGSYVSLPVCWAAAILRIPYITHDSDALPSLTNRLIAPWARLHAVALPKNIYRYPADKTISVGVPISAQFTPVSEADRKRWKEQLELQSFEQILFITGGGTGAATINNAAVMSAAELLARYPKLGIVHLTGRKHEVSIRKQYKQFLPQNDHQRVITKGFITNVYQYSGIADIVVTRAGATALAEFAAQAKTCVVVPNPLLTGGHQLKNAQVLQDRKAVRMVNELTLQDDPKALLPPIVDLLDHPSRAQALGTKLSSLAHPQAATELAKAVLDIADGVAVQVDDDAV